MNSLSYRPTWAEIDRAKLKRNFRKIRDKKGSSSFLCPMVKANAYGHGDIEVSRALREESAEHLGVVMIEEGLRLRESGDCGAILIFGSFDERGAKTMLEASLTPVVSERAQLETLAIAARSSKSSSPVPIHIEFNTGMNRLGLEVPEAKDAREWLDREPAFKLGGVCTHLFRGDDAGHEGGDSSLQVARFREVLQAFRGLDFAPHILNSSAWADTQVTDPTHAREFGTRVGIALYGVEPSHLYQKNQGLEPVLTWKSQIINIHHLKTGEAVSYGARWHAIRDSVIGVVAAGYADGYSRALTNKGEVLFRGKRAPVIGTVCMDYFMIDLTEIVTPAGEPKVGEEVVLIGEQQGQSVTADQMSTWLDTIAYEVLARIGTRVPRIYK